MYDPDSANQREKNEELLKKEIKKLQKLRDSIKTWAASPEIKDKKALLDARKNIEREMERFKVCEKETKTKAFSKEGLGQQPKADPKERARSEAREWLNHVVDELGVQVDGFEAEMESLTSAGKKGKTKPPRLVHLEESVARHKEHVIKLEQARSRARQPAPPPLRLRPPFASRRRARCTPVPLARQVLRLLDNEALSPEDISGLKARRRLPPFPALVLTDAGGGGGSGRRSGRSC